MTAAPTSTISFMCEQSHLTTFLVLISTCSTSEDLRDSLFIYLFLLNGCHHSEEKCCEKYLSWMSWTGTFPHHLKQAKECDLVWSKTYEGQLMPKRFCHHSGFTFLLSGDQYDPVNKKWQMTIEQSKIKRKSIVWIVCNIVYLHILPHQMNLKQNVS